MLGGWLLFPASAADAASDAFPLISPQFVVLSADLLPEQPVAPQPEAVPPAMSLAVSVRAGAELADTGFHAIWLLPLAGGLILLGVLFALFASRKQRRDEEQLVAEQAELARQAALAEIADREALSELEELEELDRAAERRPADDAAAARAPHDAAVPALPIDPDSRVHPVEPRGPSEPVGPFVSLPDDRVGPATGADSHEENEKRPDAP